MRRGNGIPAVREERAGNAAVRSALSALVRRDEKSISGYIADAGTHYSAALHESKGDPDARSQLRTHIDYQFGILGDTLRESGAKWDLVRMAQNYRISLGGHKPSRRSSPLIALTIIGFGGAIGSFLYNQSMTAAAIGVSSSSPMQFFGLLFFLVGCFGIFMWRKR
ncbi:Uncharacterised protein [uncultured archaeon]|nr:Uncharacterised protein [uncultured archaeon]